jgi:hypothetical protein
MSYLRFVLFVVHSGFQHILCCVFCFVFLCLVYPMLPVSADCPFLIARSVFLRSKDYNVKYFTSLYLILWFFSCTKQRANRVRLVTRGQ